MADSTTNQTIFINTHAAATLTGLSASTLKRYRLCGLLQENIHWVRLNPRTIRFCAPLIIDWMQNQHFPELHQQAINNYQATLLSYKNKKSK